MTPRIALACLAVGLALVGVAAPASADEAPVVCTMSMPPECQTAEAVVVCTLSMPPECRTG